MYCAWPRSARTCTPRAIVSDGASPAAQPPLIQAGPAPGALTIVSAREQQIVRVDSADGGATFTAPAAFGRGHYFQGAFGPAGVMLTYRTAFSYRAFAGPATDDSSVVLGSRRRRSWRSTPDGRPVLVSGAAAPGIALDGLERPGEHQRPLDLEREPQDRRVQRLRAHGRAARRLARLRRLRRRPRQPRDRAQVQRGEVRRRAPHPAGGQRKPFVAGIAIAQAPNGSFLVVWLNGPSGRIEYSVSKTGKRWSTPRLLTTGVVQISRIQAAFGDDGRGLAVWDQTARDQVQASKVDARRALRTTR